MASSSDTHLPKDMSLYLRLQEIVISAWYLPTFKHSNFDRGITPRWKMFPKLIFAWKSQQIAGNLDDFGTLINPKCCVCVSACQCVCMSLCQCVCMPACQCLYIYVCQCVYLYFYCSNFLQGPTPWQKREAAGLSWHWWGWKGQPCRVQTTLW